MECECVDWRIYELVCCERRKEGWVGLGWVGLGWLVGLRLAGIFVFVLGLGVLFCLFGGLFWGLGFVCLVLCFVLFFGVLLFLF